MAESTVGLLRVVLASNSAQFSTEMGKASTSVQGFDTKAKAAGTSLSNMVKGFDGTKLAAEATKVVTAINQVGGASKLTETELNRVRSTLDATIDKFGKLRQQVPADIAAVRAEITALDQAAGRTAAPSGGLGQWSGALGTISRLLPGLSVAGAVASIVSLGKAAFDSADKIVTLSERTGVSIETIQRWQYVADQTGTSIEAFSTNAFKLGVNIANGSDKVRAAVAQLGLSYQDIKSQKPEEIFAIITEKMEGVESVTERNRLGVLLYGKTWSEIAPAVSEGMTRIASEATVAGEAQVRAAEAAGDAWQRLKSKIASISLIAVGTMASELLDTAASLDTLTQSEMQAFTVAQRLGEGHLYLVNLQRERMRGQKDINLAVQGGVAAETDYVKQLAAVRAEVAALTPEQRAQLDAALKLSGATEELATQFGLSEEALRIYQTQAKEATKATSALTKENEKATRELERFWEQADRLGTNTIPNLIFQLGKWETVARDHVTLVSQTAMEYGKATAAAQAWANANGAVLAPSIKNVSAQSILAEEGTLSSFQRIFGGAEGLGNSITSIFQAAFTGGGGALGAVQSFATQSLGALLGMIPGVGQWASAFAGPIVAMLSKLAGKFKSFFSGLFGGPSGSERAGRASVAAFEDELRGTLTAAQNLEAGGEDWKETIIAIRDAYIAAGRSGEEALTDAKRLWESSTISAEESARVIEEIRRKMQALPTEHTIEINVETNLPGDGRLTPDFRNPDEFFPLTDPGFAGGTMSRFGSFFKNFGANFPTSLHGVEAVLRPQDAIPFANRVLAGLTPGSAEGGAGATSINILPVLIGSNMSPRDMARQVSGHIASSGLEMNEGGLTTAIENVFHNLTLTYAR